MAVRALALALVLVGGLFAGCIGGKDEAPTTVRKANVTLNNTFAKPPDGREGEVSAFKETNQTESGAGGIAHTHDYWAGRDRITLFSLDSFMAPNTGGANEATAVFGVPKPTLVYEGTSGVEFTVSDPKRHACEGRIRFNNHFVCTDDNAGFAPLPPVYAPDPTGGPSGLKLRYRHASTSTWIDAGTLTWGQPLKIKVTDAKQTDMPHSTTSLWQFEVISPNGYDNTLEFHAKAEITRDPTVPIPLWPAHPLFYTNESHVRLVYDGMATSTNGLVQVLTGTSPATPDAGPVIPERLVSYGTKSVYVWANVTEIQTPNPATAPDGWYLYHTNATGEENVTGTANSTVSADGKSFFWVLPVLPDDMDSPYQDKSRWQFALQGILGTCINCADYTVKYHLTVKSSDLDETGKYTIYCWDSKNC